MQAVEMTSFGAVVRIPESELIEGNKLRYLIALFHRLVR
jgi:hypothetical protein